MTPWTTASWPEQRRETLDALIAEFLQHYAKGRTIFAIDGIDGAGKTRFADGLAEQMQHAGHAVARASIDGFHRPRAERYARGSESPEGYYRDSFDYALARRLLIDPFRLGDPAGFVTAAFDVELDEPVAPHETTAPKNATLILDGIFLNRPELRGLWNYSVWLEVPREIAEARMLERDGVASKSRYELGQQLYLAEAGPRAVASAIIDNSDFEHPRRVYADTC